jgi:hypothetical protein
MHIAPPAPQLVALCEVTHRPSLSQQPEHVAALHERHRPSAQPAAPHDVSTWVYTQRPLAPSHTPAGT